jgi:uncharacterized protein
LATLEDETGVDVKIVTVDSVPGGTLEQFATKTADDLRAGQDRSSARGIVVVFDNATSRMRIEVGQGMEAIFPDAYVGFLVSEHARYLFRAGQPTRGLGLLTVMLTYRIRDAELGGAYDPRADERLRAHASAGAGATDDSPIGRDARTTGGTMRRADWKRFAPGNTPEKTIDAFYDWLGDETLDALVDIFTPASQAYMNSPALTPARKRFLFTMEYGHTYDIVRRDSLAMLVFTDSPLLSPKYLRRNGRGQWQLDILAEIRHTDEYMGYPFSWALKDANDEYDDPWNDIIERIPVGNDTFPRLKIGDNRRLPVLRVEY